MYNTILVPLDGSRAGAEALDHASALATSFGSELVLLRVVAPARAMVLGIDDVSSVSMMEITAETAETENRKEITKARSYLNTWRRKLEKRDIKARAEVKVGDPADVIKRFAATEHADLIIMTTRGRSGVKRALLGSVADEVVRSDVAPVLLLRR